MQLANMNVGNGQPLFVIAKPRVIESESMIMSTTQTLKRTRKVLAISLIFKSSFDKANGSSIDSDRGFAVHSRFLGRDSAGCKSDGPLVLVNQLLGQLQAIDATVKKLPRPEE